MALAWSYAYFLKSVFNPRSRPASIVVNTFARLTSFWLKYFDPFIIENSNSINAASGYYFIGRKSETPLSDIELLSLYRGPQF
jgi:hypothetical protein